MNEYKFGVTGKDRKALVTAISEILNTPSVYLKTPTYAFQVGSYHIDKNGTVTGEFNLTLFAALENRGFKYEPSKTFHLITPRGTFLIQARYDTAAEAEEAGYSNYFHHDGRDVYIKPSGNGEHCKHFAVVGAPFEKAEAETPESQSEAETETCTEPIAETAPETSEPETPAMTEAETEEMETPAMTEAETEEMETPAEAMTEPEAASDRHCIEVPLDGFTPESIDNLCKMVSAKEPLIKKALGADKLPIRLLKDRIAFDWFSTADNMDEYAQFITQLCKTAKEKKRVTAKAHENFENEKFAMRVWLIGLGLIGKQYLQIRKLMANNLSGDAAFRYGKPEKADEKNTVAV